MKQFNYLSTGGVLTTDMVNTISVGLNTSAFITFIITIMYFMNFIYQLNSQLLYADGKYNICRKTPYENETIRYMMYSYFKDTSKKNKFKQTYWTLLVITLVFALGSIIFNVIYEKYTIGFLISIISVLFLLNSIYLVNNTLDTIYKHTDEYKKNFEYLKEQFFTYNSGQSDVPLSYFKQRYIENNRTIDNQKIQLNGLFVTLGNNVYRRLFHTDDNIDNINDAENTYLELLKPPNGDGVLKLMGYIQYTRNSEDYNLLQSAVCGTNLCAIGIHQRLKAMTIRNFQNFKNHVNELINLTDNNAAMENKKTTILEFVKTFDNDLYILLANIQNDSNGNETWSTINNITQQKDLTSCECNNDPLQLGGKKLEILKNLNYMATITNGDPSVAIQKDLYSFTTFFIILFIVLGYILTHGIYMNFDKKYLISGYFSIIILIAILGALISRIS
jgi:hypothetical protein